MHTHVEIPRPCVAMWLAEVLQKYFTTSSFRFFPYKHPSHSLIAQNSKLLTKAMYIHERDMLTLCKMIIQNMTIYALIRYLGTSGGLAVYRSMVKYKQQNKKHCYQAFLLHLMPMKALSLTLPWISSLATPYE